MRFDGRRPDETRKITIQPHVSRYAEGSVTVEFGFTKVLCTASVETQVPKWLIGSEKGWVTAEYGMLPRSTHTRMARDKTASGGRTQEISRLIARALRAAVDLKALGEKQIVIDCDVLQADGGTRTAAISGGFVALALALHKLKAAGLITSLPIKDYVGAISAGLDKGVGLLDLCYEEDSQISTDMNFVMTGQGKFIEVQGTAEGDAFSREEMLGLLDLAKIGCQKIFQEQYKIIGEFFPAPGLLLK